MSSLLFTIEVSAGYRDTHKIYSAQVIACNGEKLYHVAEAMSLSEALEQIVKQMQLQEKNSSSSGPRSSMFDTGNSGQF